MKRQKGKTGLLRLLVVDDDPTSQKAAAAIVQELGHSVTLAANGREALRRLDLLSFDAVLMDLHMPMLDGIGATREIVRDFPEKRRPVIIALVGTGNPEDVLEFLAAGARACLRKPLDAHELATLLEAIVAAR